MKQKLQDEMFEAMLRNAFQDHHEEETLSPEEELRVMGVKPHQFSPEFERKMEKLIRKARRKEWREKHRKGIRQLAAMLAVVFLAGGILVTQVDAFRVPVMNVIITIGERCSEIGLQEPERKQVVSGKYDDYLPQYILPGFCIESVTEEGNLVRVHYVAEDESGDFYSVTVAPIVRNSSSSYDTENATITEILIQDYPAVLIEKLSQGEPYTQIVWFPAGDEYHLSGYLLGEEAIQVLESVKKFL